MAKVYGDPVAACPACDFPLGKLHPYVWCCNCGSPLPPGVTALLTLGPTARVRLRPSRILAVVMGCCAAVFFLLGAVLIAFLLGSEYKGSRLTLASLGTGFLAGAWKLAGSSMVALRVRADQRIFAITFDPSVGWSLAWPDGHHVELGHRINGGMREDYLQVVGWSDREEIEFAVHPELVGVRNVAALAFWLNDTPRYCPACRIAAPPAAAQCEKCGTPFMGGNPEPADPRMTPAEMASTRQTYARLPTARLEELLRQCGDLRPDAVRLLVEELDQREDRER